MVFFGDSITCGGKWNEYFPDQQIINLGLVGDTILGMQDRIDMIEAVKPEKVFILGGINSLNEKNSEQVLEQYKTMLERIQKSIPNARIYIQSVLPISKEKEKECVSNQTIIMFNRKLETIASKFGITYINIHDLYTSEGVMDLNKTTDGIHLKKEMYGMWAERIRTYMEE